MSNRESSEPPDRNVAKRSNARSDRDDSPLEPRRRKTSSERPRDWKLWAAAIALGVLVVGVVATVVVMRLSDNMGVVEIDINEPGADVAIDGRHRLTIKDENIEVNVQIDIEEGDHELTISKQGYITETKAFKVEARKRTTVRVTLLPDIAKSPVPDAAIQPKGVAAKAGGGKPKSQPTVDPKKKAAPG